MDNYIKYLRKKIIMKYLVRWRNLPIEDVTWKGPEIVKNPNLHCLRTNNLGEGGLVISL